jgi:hypothetical protein
VTDPTYAAFTALDPFFAIVQQGWAGLVDGDQEPRVAIIEYDVHGKIVANGSSYDNRFISVVTIETREIVKWRDYMDSPTAMTACSSMPAARCPLLWYACDASSQLRPAHSAEFRALEIPVVADATLSGNSKHD